MVFGQNKNSVDIVTDRNRNSNFHCMKNGREFPRVGDADVTSPGPPSPSRIIRVTHTLLHSRFYCSIHKPDQLSVLIKRRTLFSNSNNSRGIFSNKHRNVFGM
jgi:hypothetical protein